MLEPPGGPGAGNFFVSRGVGNTIRKINENFRLSIFLNFFFSGPSREAALKKAHEDDENKDMEQYWFEEDLGSNNSGYYELQAVLTHKGRSSNSGHYVAWVKYKGDTWIECNDDDVNPIHVEDVLKLSGGGKEFLSATFIYSYLPNKSTVPNKRTGSAISES